jgi:uncharacterized damage-inducible protein DinB
MQPEYWLRGPVKGVAAFLQPVAHALLQAREEIKQIVDDIPHDKLWMKPKNTASAGFHLRHMTGVLDRLFTYAKGKQLSDDQLKYLVLEGTGDDATTATGLFEQFSRQVDLSIEQLKCTHSYALTDPRGVGRKQLPSTVLGLLFHAAEHTMRHTGQLLVTVKWIMGPIKN